MNGNSVEGNGFLFSDYTPHSLYDAMERCAAFFKKANENLVQQARRKAENTVHYWDHSALNYIDKIYSIKEMIRLAPT